VVLQLGLWLLLLAALAAWMLTTAGRLLLAAAAAAVLLLVLQLPSHTQLWQPATAARLQWHLFHVLRLLQLYSGLGALTMLR
jgi:hypothetical protein